MRKNSNINLVINRLGLMTFVMFLLGCQNQQKSQTEVISSGKAEGKPFKTEIKGDVSEIQDVTDEKDCGCDTLNVLPCDTVYFHDTLRMRDSTCCGGLVIINNGTIIVGDNNVVGNNNAVGDSSAVNQSETIVNNETNVSNSGSGSVNVNNNTNTNHNNNNNGKQTVVQNTKQEVKPEQPKPQQPKPKPQQPKVVHDTVYVVKPCPEDEEVECNTHIHVSIKGKATITTKESNVVTKRNQSSYSNTFVIGGNSR